MASTPARRCRPSCSLYCYFFLAVKRQQIYDRIASLATLQIHRSPSSSPSQLVASPWLPALATSTSVNLAACRCYQCRPRWTPLPSSTSPPCDQRSNDLCSPGGSTRCFSCEEMKHLPFVKSAAQLPLLLLAKSLYVPALFSSPTTAATRCRSRF
ncbi:hypothetical protein GW17_00054666 [Ensete ventricosum]|nr:hypothetical protein GW17_00054666 [Ensete ventricosum]